MSEIKNKPAQINLIDPNTGEKREPVDVRTRSDLVRHGEGTVEDAINNVEEKLLDVSRHVNYKCFDIQGSWTGVWEMGSAHNIHYEITKGSLDIESIIVSINDRKQPLSEKDITTLNETGKLTVNIEVSSSISKDVIVKVDVYDADGWGSVLDKIRFRYPIYTIATGSANEKLLTPEFIKSGKKHYDDNFHDYVEVGSITDEMYRMVVAVPADRTLEKATFLYPFNIINTMNKDRVFIDCADGTTQTYNVFYTNGLTVPKDIDRWDFSLVKED